MPMYLCFVSLVSFATTVLSSHDIYCMACKAKNIYYVSGSLQEKCWCFLINGVLVVRRVCELASWKRK